MRLDEAAAGEGHGPAQLAGLAPRELVRVRAGRGLHGRKLPERVLVQVVHRTDEHHLGLASQDGVHRDRSRLHGRGARTHGRLDGSGRGEQEHVQPGRRGVDERLLQHIALDPLRVGVVAVREHLLEAAQAADARADGVADLREVHVLVELVGVHDSALPEGLRAAHQRVERHAVDLADDLLRDAEVLGIPVARHLRTDPAVRPERPRHKDLGALEHAHRPRARRRLGELAEVAVLLGKLARDVPVVHLDGWEFFLEENCVVHHRVRAVEAIQNRGVQDPHAAAAEDPLLIKLFHVPITDWLAGRRVDPAAVVHRWALGGRLRPVEVLDEAQHPGQQDAALNAELPVPLHLPPRPRVAPGADLPEASDDDGGGGVHHAPQLREGRTLLR
mmetsp:Transcript_45069/g.140062  ORF Transcript_45069/g.140062 Transcript_45069/m.140062 type:complete len:389 (+) Transcript_45069:2164-3330(+)